MANECDAKRTPPAVALESGFHRLHEVVSVLEALTTDLVGPYLNAPYKDPAPQSATSAPQATPPADVASSLWRMEATLSAIAQRLREVNDRLTEGLL